MSILLLASVLLLGVVLGTLASQLRVRFWRASSNHWFEEAQQREWANAVLRVQLLDGRKWTHPHPLGHPISAGFVGEFIASLPEISDV